MRPQAGGPAAAAVMAGVVMNKFILLAETGADIPRDLAQQYGIYIVPMHVAFGDVVKDDGSFPTTEVCDYYERTGRVPKTMGCNPEDFTRIFDEIHAEHPESHIIYMAYSAVTTCSYQSGKIASEGLDYVSCMDTKHVTAGQGAAVIRMAQELERHPDWSLEEALAAARRICDSVRMCFIPSNLDYLRAGGRVSNAAAICGNLLSIHPRIELLDGYLKATRKYRGKMGKVLTHLISDFVDENDLDRGELWMGHTPGFTEELKQTADRLAREFGFQLIHWIHTGGVITTHGGANAFCIAGFAR